MLVTIRQFAAERLQEWGEVDATREQHLAYFLDFAERADQEIHGPEQIQWMDRLETEHDNLRSALDWCVAMQKTESALRLLAAVGGTWRSRGYYGEYRSWFERIRALPDVENYPAAYARVLNGVAHMAWNLRDRDAKFILETSQAIWQQLGSEGEQGLAETLDLMGMIARWIEFDIQSAQNLIEQAVELYRKCGDQWGLAESLFHLGIVAEYQNDEARSFALFKESMSLFNQLGDLEGMGRVSQYLGHIFLRQRDYNQARLHYEQHLTIAQRVRAQWSIYVALHNLGILYRRQGNDAQAERYFESSLAVCREYDLKYGMGDNLYLLGLTALHQNNYALAAQRFIAYYELIGKLEKKISACDLLMGLAAVAGGTNQPERAAKLYGAAQTILDATDYRFPPFDQAELDRPIQIAREQIGAGAFEAFAVEGYEMKVEEAIEFALKGFQA
jgi:tetratricopeptide (TPR) repeat protein